jgi:hypothetical protein
MKRRPGICLGLAAVAALACSPSRMAVHQAVELCLRAMPAYDRETDVQFAAQAVAGHIQLLEGFLESAPDDPRLLLALARSYARYAHGFVRLEIECADYAGDGAARDRGQARAADFYARARAYGTRALVQRQPALAAALVSDSSALDSQLGECGVADAPALFWTAFAWGNELSLRPATPQALEALGKAAQLMRRVVELDERIVCGSAHLFLGSYYGRLPAFLGGDAARAEAHFRRAHELDSGSCLPARLAQAEHAWRVTLDTSGYIDALRDIVVAPEAAVPGYRLDDAVARRQAGVRLAVVDSTFACECAVRRLAPGR